MYDELIKRLRKAAISADSGNEISESLYLDILQAADAIEELSAIREEQKAQIILMAAEIEEQQPGWIPVTEALPKKTNHYLVHVKCGCDGKFVSAWEQVAWFCEKFYWEHLHGDDVFKETVTHWMPLPKPPKEE